MTGRIYLVTFNDEDIREVVVSHGINLQDGRNVVLSCDPLDKYKRQGAKWDPEEMAWFIDGDFADRPDVMVSKPRPLPPPPVPSRAAVNYSSPGRPTGCAGVGSRKAETPRIGVGSGMHPHSGDDGTDKNRRAPRFLPPRRLQ